MIIPNFLGGVSQQPDDLRLPNQVKAAVNAGFSPTEGLSKRLPTQHLGQVATTLLSNRRLHAIDRDDTQYLLIVGQGDLRVLTTAGMSVPIRDTTAAGPSYTPNFSYLSGTTRDTLRCQTIVDTTFILNKSTVVTGATGAAQQSWVDDGEAGVFVKQAAYGTEYTIEIKTSSMGSSQLVKYMTHSGRAYEKNLTGTAVVATAGQTVFNTALHYNAITDLTIEKSAGAASIAYEDWVEGPGEFELTYIGATPWAAGNTVTFKRPVDIVYSRGIRTSYIAKELRDKLSDLAITGLTIEGDDEDSSFRVTCTDPIEIFEVTDGNGNAFMTGWTNEVKSIVDLPTVWKHGAIVRVSNNTSEAEDDYYVRFAGDEWSNNEDRDYSTFNTYSNFGQGRWEEYTLPVTGEGAFTASTMPHVLIRSLDDGSGTFTGVPNQVFFDYHPWSEWNIREAGDSKSNKVPSFVGKSISDIFFWKNRLGFLSSSNVILSEAGNISNFWRTTVIGLPDSDRIDVASTEDEGSSLVHAVPLDTRLYLFSRQSQIALVGDPTVTPRTVEAPVVSKFLAADNVPPALIGRSLYFAFPSANYLGFREFLPGDNALQFGDIEVTAAVPEYVPKGAGRIVGSTVDGSLFFHTVSDPSRVWVYRYLRAGGELLMSSWSNWAFSGTVVDIVVLDEVLYLLTQHSTRTYLEKIPLGSGQADSNSEIVIRLDRKVPDGDVTVGAYDIPLDRTPFTLPYLLDSTTDIQVVTRAAGGGEVPGGILQTESVVGSTIYVRGDHTATPVWLGVPYTFSITMNRPAIQIPVNQGSTPIRSGVTLVRELKLIVDDTGFLTATVTARGGNTYEYPFTGNGLGMLGAGLESDDFETSQPVRDALHRIAIHNRPQDFKVVISNTTPLPCNLVSGEWDIRYLP